MGERGDGNGLGGGVVGLGLGPGGSSYDGFRQASGWHVDSFIPFWRSHYTVIHMLARGGYCDWIVSYVVKEYY
jgi:hypothetical protein